MLLKNLGLESEGEKRKSAVQAFFFCLAGFQDLILHFSLYVLRYCHAGIL
jgi:hypothetical protein